MSTIVINSKEALEKVYNGKHFNPYISSIHKSIRCFLHTLRSYPLVYAHHTLCGSIIKYTCVQWLVIEQFYCTGNHLCEQCYYLCSFTCKLKLFFFMNNTLVFSASKCFRHLSCDWLAPLLSYYLENVQIFFTTYSSFPHQNYPNNVVFHHTPEPCVYMLQ